MAKQSSSVHDLLIRKASQHGTLLQADKAALLSLPFVARHFRPGQDIVRQGDEPDAAILVQSGMIARYHTLSSGERQYISMHIKGDMPDVQSLFLKVMDHSLCAVDDASIALFRHDVVRRVLVDRPGLSFALWRLTLVDAAIFRQAITNNGSRAPAERLAHFCCERYTLACEMDLAEGNVCDLPLTQAQLGQALGLSHISVNRALRKLRRERLLDLRSGKLHVIDWSALARFADFDPSYLHQSKDSDLSHMAFRKRR